MNGTQVFLAAPVKTAVLRFLGLMGIALVLAMARRMGLIGLGEEQRAMGVLIGVMLLVIGNLLPKMRPLQTPGCPPAQASSAERLAGWVMVSAGIVYLALFLLAPLDRARMIASLIGIGALLVIALSWARWARVAWVGWDKSAGKTAGTDRRAKEQRKVVVALLFAFFYLLATACVTFLFRDQDWFHDLAAWILVGFCFLFAVFGNDWCERSPRRA
ncbi:MAG: hypothetical protein AB7V26_14335 [Lysobacterales bacterium]